MDARAGITTLSSRQDLDSMVLGLAEPAMLIGKDRRILIANRQAGELFGWDATALAGQPMDVLIPESVAMAHRDWSEDYFANPTARPMGEYPRAEGVRRNGERIRLEISLSPVKVQAENLVFVIARSTNSITAGHAIPLNELSALSELARLVSGPMEATEVYRRMARQIRSLLPYNQLLVCAFDPNTSILRDLYTIRQGSMDDERGQSMTLGDDQASGLRAMTRPAIFIGGAVPSWFVDMAHNLDRGNEGLGSLLAAPLRWNGEVIGTLTVRSNTDFAYSEKSLKLVEQIATLLASVVAKSRSQNMAAQAIDQRTVLANIGRLVGSAPEIRVVFESLATQIDQLIPIDRLAVISVNTERGRYFIEADWGANNPDLVRGQVRDLAGTGTDKAVLADGPVIFTGQQIRAIRTADHPETPDGVKMRSWLAAPLKLRGETIGVIHFRSFEANVYETVHLDIAQQIAAQFAGTIGNAPVILDSGRERRIRNSVIELTRAIVRSDQLEVMVEAVKDQLSQFVEFDGFSTTTVGKEPGESRMIYRCGVELDGFDTDKKSLFAGLIARGARE